MLSLVWLGGAEATFVEERACPERSRTGRQGIAEADSAEAATSAAASAKAASAAAAGREGGLADGSGDSGGPSGPPLPFSACTLPEANHAFFTFAEGDRLVFFILLFGCGRGAEPRGRDGLQTCKIFFSAKMFMMRYG